MHMGRAVAIVFLAVLHAAALPWSTGFPCCDLIDCTSPSVVCQAEDDAPKCCCCCTTDGEDASACPCATEGPVRPVTPPSTPARDRVLDCQLVLLDWAPVSVMLAPCVELSRSAPRTDRRCILAGVSVQARLCVWRI